ncbi:MAG: nicotinate-nucleotide adenylyltransferase [Candidatus Omnitrophota bacterium]
MARLENKKRIGILGGTFDPIHLGHLVLAETARTVLALDEVLLMPARIPPHKHRKNIIDIELRYKMVRLAIAGNKFLKASRIEIDRSGVSYTVETLHLLRRKFPQAELYLIIGSDAIPELKTWKNIEEIFGLCNFVIAGRPSFKKFSLPEGAKFLDGFFWDISSSQIRKLIRQGKSVRYLVPEPVNDFIKKNSLYRLNNS